MLPLSEKVQNIVESNTVKLAETYRKMRKEGKDVISLIIGEPDLPVPSYIKDATIQAIQEDKTNYSEVPGLTSLREGIANISNSTTNAITKDHVFLANGSKQSLFLIFQAICNRGDEVIIPRPFWVTFPESVKLSGANPVFANCLADFTPDAKEIKSLIGTKTKAIILNYPNNPSGAIPSKDSIQDLLKVCISKDIYLIIDEAYNDLVYSKSAKIDSISLWNQYPEHVIITRSFSKSFSMTGFRIGYTITSLKLAKAFNKLQSHICGNISTFSQFGALKAIEGKLYTKELDTRQKYFIAKRDRMFALAKGTFDSLTCPPGGLFLFPNVKKFFNEEITNDIDLTLYLLEKANVAIVPGSAFGLEDHLRISFAASDHDIDVGIERINNALSSLLTGEK
ncbi:aminotransferase class I/II-fold pyridoxal phosphate-dependent enzyme [Bacteriovoracaceae bacterium]|nr:aminotransferase class I/II-fold pyridoxal phosphate-dependent enzyme [Bacteriovoracaceae bacterium]